MASSSAGGLLTALAGALALTFLSLKKLHDHTSHHDDGHDINEEAATPAAADEAGVEAADDEGTGLINAIQAHGHGSGSADVVRTRAVELQWHQLNCMISDKKRNKRKHILKNLSGEAKSGRLLAIMGPSGSGKTTLLNVLAGQVSASSRLTLTGHLYINGKAISSSSPSSSYKVAYVRQEDIFFSQLTVRETLSLAAELQLPSSLTSEERTKYVDNILQRLGLISCAETRVGDAKVRGISGGEKKRLSIACELIASPSVIFADEPTTGLDAFQAERVMETLQNLAKDGHTVVCSIHQPRGSIYAKFDDIILLSQGSLVYGGPAKDDALSYFSGLASSENEESTQKRVQHLVQAYKEHKLYISDELSYNVIAKPQKIVKDSCRIRKPHRLKFNKVGWWKQFRLLLKRAWLQTIRDGPTNKVRAKMSISSAIIFGSIFWRMGFMQTAIQDRMGLLQVAAINTAMAALTKTVNIFPKEKQIVDRERAKGSYQLGPYLLSKLIAEVPISASFPLVFGTILYPMAGLNKSLIRFGQFCSIITIEAFAASAMGLTVGAMVPTTEAAMALGPSLMTVFIVFGGYYVNSGNTPGVFRWIPRASLIRWAFQGLCLNEFRGLKFEHSNSYDLQTGEQVLERMSFANSSIKDAMTQEARILLFWYWMSYILLQRNKPKFQELEVPSSKRDSSVKIDEIEG